MRIIKKLIVAVIIAAMLVVSVVSVSAVSEYDKVATSDSAEITSGMSTPQVIILSFVGVAIIGGVVALIFAYKKQRQVDEIGDAIKLINTYEKYKAVHTGLQNSKNPSRYKKENINALHKYDDAVNKLLNLYPDKTSPRIEKLTNERNHLIEDIKELNEQYKQTVSELKELEFARQSIEDYLKASDKSHKNELE